MSPKVVTMTSGCLASSMAMSMSSLAVTHTGQPGPESRVTLLGHDGAQAVLGDRDGVRAAHLHDLDRAGVLGGRVDSLDQTPGDLGVAESTRDPSGLRPFESDALVFRRRTGM